MAHYSLMPIMVVKITTIVAKFTTIIVVIVVILLLGGCATMKTIGEPGKYSITVPKEIPDFWEWEGPMYPYMRDFDENVLVIMWILLNPKDYRHSVSMLLYVDDPKLICFLLTESFSDPYEKEKTEKMWADKQFLGTKKPSGKFTRIDKWPDLDFLKTNKDRINL